MFGKKNPIKTAIADLILGKAKPPRTADCPNCKAQGTVIEATEVFQSHPQFNVQHTVFCVKCGMGVDCSRPHDTIMIDLTLTLDSDEPASKDKIDLTYVDQLFSGISNATTSVGNAFTQASVTMDQVLAAAAKIKAIQSLPAPSPVKAEPPIKTKPRAVPQRTIRAARTLDI